MGTNLGFAVDNFNESPITIAADMGGEKFEGHLEARFRVLRVMLTLKAAVLCTAVTVLALGGLAYAFWPGPARQAGPITHDMDTYLPPGHYAAGPATEPGPLMTEARPTTVERSLTVKSGDTLMALLTGAGIPRPEAHSVITALSEVFKPRDLMPGQEILLQFASADPGRLLSLGLQPDVEHDIRVSRAGDATFVAEAVERELAERTLSAEGTIDSNLSAAARAAGLPMPVLLDLIRVFSFVVDFQREIQPGDAFEVLYEALYEEDGRLAKTGDVIYASLTLSGDRQEYYDFTPKDAVNDFFDLTGQSVRKTLMRTPLDGARLTSGYGMRRHPVLGYSKMHQGTDFAAPRGTPIYAAGDGVIEAAGRHGAYGRYVRIKHNSTYTTAYAHMKSIRKGMRRGKRVRQGQVIGYVGSSGRSTGPHLHYEVMVRGKQVNPLKIKLPSGQKLRGKALERFQARVVEIDLMRDTAKDLDTRVARAACADSGGAC